MPVQLKFVIWSLEHNAWWTPNWQGYTTNPYEAGHYSKNETKDILAQANVMRTNECAIPVECLLGVEHR